MPIITAVRRRQTHGLDGRRESKEPGLEMIAALTRLFFRIRYPRQALWSAVVACAIALTALLVFRSDKAETSPVGWERTFTLSPFNVIAENHSAAARNQYIVVAFEGKEGGSRSVYAAVSFNGGKNFLPAVRIATVRSMGTLHPSPAVSSKGQITVMWDAYLEDESTTRIFSSSSENMGASWSEPEKLSLGHAVEMLPRVYYDDRDSLHLFYHGGKGQTISLYHAERGESVKYLTTAMLVKLSSRMRGAFFPAIQLSGKYIFVAWQGKEEDFSDEIFFIRSSNYGSGWSIKKRITSSKGNNEAPALAVRDGALYMAYQNNDDKTWSIKMKRSFNHGQSWDDEPLRVSGTDANCFAPQVAMARNDLLVAWYDMRNGFPQIYSRKYSLADGKFGKEDVNLSDGRNQGRSPSLVVVGPQFIVLWEERNMVVGKSSDIYVDPPVVRSDTHPPGAWSRVPVMNIRWTPPRDESGIVGYSFLVSKKPDDIPELDPTNQTWFTRQIDDGVSYFHIRAVDGAGNYSRTVHYRIQSCASTPPIPVIVSTTHPQGKSTPSNNAEFRWAVDDTERIKGFMYGLSRYSIRKPDKMTTAFSASFKDLEDGYYFLTVTAVDRANQSSEVAVYNFIVGEGRELSEEDLKRLAEEEKRLRTLDLGGEGGGPIIAVHFPFDTKKEFNGISFNAVIEPKNIAPDRIAGYSVSLGERGGEPLHGVNLKGNVLRVRDLRSGTYQLTIRGKYHVYADGARKEAWTPPFNARIVVLLESDRSPIERYGAGILAKLTGKGLKTAIAVFCMAFAVSFVGYGGRMQYYAKLAAYRARRLVRSGA